MSNKEDFLLTEDVIYDGMAEYSKELLLNRAIPFVQDGLKPVQRRIVYAMHDMDIHFNKKTVKNTRIVGEVMGKYHPHGDCLGADTKFLLTNGTHKTIYEMYEETFENPNKTFEIYSINKENKIVKAVMRNVRIGQYSDAIYNIKFSNNEIIRATGNHPFMSSNYNFLETRKLKTKDLLLHLRKEESLLNQTALLKEEFEDIINIRNLNNYIMSKSYNKNKLNEFKSNHIYIEKIVISKLEEKIPMYDFTVDGYENAIVSLNEKDFIVAHNSSIYDALIILSRDWIQRLPLIEIQGNNGNIEGASAASSRYTEARLSKASDLLVADINKNAVEFISNYDGSTKEPTLLPTTIPLALINGAYGIAIGYTACSILPHNPIEIMKALIEFVKNEKITNDDLLKHIKGFDFPTGGIIINPESIAEELERGQTKVTVRGRVRKVVNKNESYLEIYEIPFRSNSAKVLNSIIKALEGNAKALRIESIENLTEDNKIKIQIICQKGTELKTLDLIEQLLYKKSELQKNIAVDNLMVSRDKHIKYFNILDYFREFVAFRYETNFNIFKFNLDKVNSQIEIQDAIKIAINNIDEIIKLAKKATSANDLKEKLLNRFKEYTERQAEYISTIPLYRIGELKRIEEILAKLFKEKEELETFLSDKKVQQKYLLDNLKEILKTFEKDENMQRKTDIIKTDLVEDITIEKEDLMEKKLVRVVILENQKAFQMGTKAFDNQIDSFNEKIIFTKECYTTDTIILTTKNGIGVASLVGNLESSTLTSINVLELFKQHKKILSDDLIVGACILEEKGKALLCTEQGFYKEIKFSELEKLTSVRGKSKALSSLKVEGDKVAFFGILESNKIKVTFKSLKSGNIFEKEITLKDREDGFGGSGSKYININGKEIQKISF